MTPTATHRRRAYLGALVVSALALGAVGATAWACSTGVNEQTYVTPTSGTHGTSLTVQSYTGGTALLHSTGGFYFRYAYPGDSLACPQEASIGASVTTTAYGDIGSSMSKYSRTISNLGSVAGTGEACWSNGGTQTNEISKPAPITVN